MGHQAEHVSVDTSVNAPTAFGVMLALLLSVDAVFVLCYGAVGISGNSAFTGTFFVTTEIALFALTVRRITLELPDWLFLFYVGCIAVSTVTNGVTADPKEFALLALSLAAYPSCRFISRSDISTMTAGFHRTIGLIATAGTILTAWTLVVQWNDPHGKPIVFGFASASIHFLEAMGFLIIALATMPLTRKQTLIATALALLAASVFSASMVRFVFIAIFAGLCLAAVLSAPHQRKQIGIIAATIIIGIVTGLVARSSQSVLYFAYATEETKALPLVGAPPTPEPTQPIEPVLAVQQSPNAMPSCGLDINEMNSIAIRKALLRDAFYLAPSAGPFGGGLDSFKDMSCVHGEAHNSPLQATVEFGWFGGAAFLLLISVAGFRITSLAKRDPQVAFICCSLLYALVLSLVYGRTSRDIVIFALAGISVGVSSPSPLGEGGPSAVLKCR